MANYEAMIVVSVAESEEKTQAVVEKFKALIEANGTIANVDDWGKRKLAYPINYEPDGYYVVITFASEPAFPAELDRVANITEGVLRLQTVKKA